MDAQSSRMISKHALARVLAVCDAAKIRLPFLEASLARGVVSFHGGEPDLIRNGTYELHAQSVTFSRGLSTDSTHRAGLDGVTSLIQRRQFSSEDAFREYGRNFGDGGGSIDGAKSRDEEFADASYPEGLGEEENMSGEEEPESNAEREMREQLLRAALSHVVCSIYHSPELMPRQTAMAKGLSRHILTPHISMQKEHGWSVAALQAGASDLGFSRSASGMVPNGAAGLVEVKLPCPL